MSVLLAVAGLLMVAAAGQRWWPACHGAPSPGCLRVPSSGYGVALPTDPWAPAAHTAVLVGLSLLCLGTAVAALPLVLPRRRRPAYAWLLCGALGTSQLLAGASPLASVALGRPDQHVWAPFVVFVRLGWPAALTLTSMLMARHVRRPGTGWVLLIVLVTASTPLGQAFLVPASTGTRSADLTPWSEAWGGACLLLAALAVWPAAYGRHRRRAPAVAGGHFGGPVVVGSYRAG